MKNYIKAFLIGLGILFSAASHAQQQVFLYEGKSYTNVVTCTCKQTMLVGTTLYVAVPRQTPSTMPQRVVDYTKNRTASAVENVIYHSINQAIWNWQSKFLSQ